MSDLNENVNQTNGADNTGSNNTDTNTIDYGKLEEIINKGISQKENSILKSYFQQQGLDEAQMKEAIDTYKTNKKAEETNSNKAFDDLTKNYESLKNQYNQAQLSNAITLSLIKKGLTDEQIPLIIKMVDKTDLINEKNEINSEKINENIDNVFKAFPNLVNKKEDVNFIKVGANNTNQYEESSDDLLRKAFGLKDKN